MNTSINISEIRINPELTESMVKLAIAQVGNEAISTRFKNDESFVRQALHMGHEILVATTIAQSWNSTAPFADLLLKFSFSGNNQELAIIGRAVLAKIRKAMRLPDEEISNALLVDRFDRIGSAI